jgi:methyl-accepting chemotaxis protein
LAAACGVLTGILTSAWLPLPLFLVLGFVVAMLSKWLTERAFAQLSSELEAELVVFKEGTFTHYIVPDQYGPLKGAASATNELLSDIRTLIHNFFSLSRSIMGSAYQVNATATSASDAIGEISETIAGIASGAADQAEESQQGVEMIEKLSTQIERVYASYQDVMREAGMIED